MEQWLTSEELRELIENGRQRGYVTIDDLLALMPETDLTPDAVEAALESLEAQGIRVVETTEASERELRQVTEHADRFIEGVEREEIDDAVQWWMRQAARAPLLSAEQEHELAIRAAVGDEEAREQLVQANLRLVISVAKHYAGRGLAMIDLIQEGNLGLLRAAAQFDPNRGSRFSTYATWWIRRAIARAVINNSRTIRIPVYVAELINKVIKTELRLQQILQREPTDEEIAAETKMSVERVREIRRAAVEPISIESPVGERDNATLGEFIPSSDIVPTPEDVTERLILREQIDMILEKLQPRERDVVRLRFGLDDGHQRTLEEVGAELKITRERVRQLELRALRKLRQIGERIEDLRRNQGLELEDALALIDTDFQ